MGGPESRGDIATRRGYGRPGTLATKVVSAIATATSTAVDAAIPTISVSGDVATAPPTASKRSSGAV